MKKISDKNDTLLTRRSFLSNTGILATAALFRPVLSWADTPSLSPEQLSFVEFSHFLTNEVQLEEIIIERVYTCLVQGDAAFLTSALQTYQAIKKAGLSNADELNMHPIIDHPLYGAIIKKTVKAFYLGYTGELVGLSAKDDSQFVTYTGALMFKPTLDATVIPSYSRGKTNYWVNPPASMKNTAVKETLI